jgi:hypothetical protein
MLRSIALMALLAIGMLSGCAMVQRGTTIAKWESGTKNDLVLKALDDGKYALLKGSDYKPQFIVELRRGDPIGFRRAGDKVIAVWGNDSRELEDGKYYWNYRGRADD